jgi:hypothetical protein
MWCPTHIVLCFCFVVLRIVYPMLPVSLNCPFLIAPSVFSYFNFHIFNELTDKLAILSRFLETMTHSPKLHEDSIPTVWYFVYFSLY